MRIFSRRRLVSPSFLHVIPLAGFPPASGCTSRFCSKGTSGVSTGGARMTKKKKASKLDKPTNDKGPTELSDDDLAKVDGGTSIGVAAPGDPGAPPGQAQTGVSGLDGANSMSNGGGGGEGKASFDTFKITPIRRPP